MMMKRWFPLIGLEIHAQLGSKSKLFSRGKKAFLASPNSLVTNFDASFPGTLPIINRRCVELAVQASIALNCNLSMRSSFDRKHYFYSDMPAGYQITQYRKPIATNGFLDIPSKDSPNKLKRVRIHQIQIEQDSGKSLHDDIEEVTLVDLNRAGIGLIEIVTSPDLRSSQEACDFVKELMLVLDYIDCCNAKMEEGELRVDVNVSVSDSVEGLGTRSEIKNINRMKGIENAIDFEIERQINILKEGGKVIQETRAVDLKGKTHSLRTKEDLYDYRFMPDGNLPDLLLFTDKTIHNSNTENPINIDEIRRNLPLLPQIYRSALLERKALSTEMINYILVNKMASYFLSIVTIKPDLDDVYVFDWLRINVLPYLQKNNITFAESRLNVEDISNLLMLVKTNQISGGVTLKAFKEGIASNRSFVQVVTEDNLFKTSDKVIIRNWCLKAIQELKEKNPELFILPEKVKAKERAWKRLVLNVHKESMRLSEGKLHSKLTRSLIEDLLLPLK